jgi:hypothetical protein
MEVAVFWTMNNDRNAVRCVAAPHPFGVELRYLMNERPLMSRVFEDWESVAGQAQIWREGLESKGWVAASETLH